MLKVTIDKLTLEEGEVKVTAFVQQPHFYAEKEDFDTPESYHETHAQYLESFEEYARLHLGEANLEQKEGG